MERERESTWTREPTCNANHCDAQIHNMDAWIHPIRDGSDHNVDIKSDRNSKCFSVYVNKTIKHDV